MSGTHIFNPGAARAAAVLGTAGAPAEMIAPENLNWQVRPDFGKSAAIGRQISGAACVPATPPLRTCLAANDEKNYAQFFAIDGTVIVPGEIVSLRSGDEKGNPDAEGVAYDAGYFYITGSHGRGRNSDADNPASYRVIRFALDPVSGARHPAGTLAAAVQSSGALRPLLAALAPVNAFIDLPLRDGGLNVEGLAVRDGHMMIGLRGPSIDGHAFIVGVDAEALFAGTAQTAALHRLALGADTGIRDLAFVEDGLLVLAGPTRDESLPFSFWLWNEAAGPARRLGVLDPAAVPPGAKAETMMVLDTAPGGFRVLVLFDGADNGGPLSFVLPR